MQRYSVRTVVKYRYANGSRIFTAAFRKSEIWAFRSIPFTVYLPYRPFCHCLLRIKIIPRQEAERASRKGKKFNYKQLRLCQIGGSGGSGCGCAASVLSAHFLPKLASGELKRILFVPTGALLSTVSFNEGQTIPGIAHGVVLESCISSAKKEG